MTAVRRLCLYGTILAGLTTALLLCHAQPASSAASCIGSFKPFVASSGLPALPALSAPQRSHNGKQRQRALATDPHQHSPFVAASSPALTLPCLGATPAPRALSLLPGPCRKRGMLPLPLAPPVHA